jgi:hypothetical protein
MPIPRIPVAVVTLLFCAAPLIGQSDKAKPPKKGDALVIRGCLRGSAVESAETMRVDAEGVPRPEDQVPTLTYRLQGKKELLKELKSKHDRKVVQVSGVLRSELSGSGLSTNVGRTRISIGVDPRSSGSPHATEAVPVLEATSFEGTTISCAR